MILQGDALETLRALPDESVQCCVTSPPYWGLRDYGASGQLGLEKTPEEYVARMVEIFREVRRVLRSDGTLWLNLGDSYAGSGKGAWDNKNGGQKEVYIPDADSPQALLPKVPPGMKAKDLVGIPWMVAFALRADGWWLRSDIIWAKPNPMPESVTDRPTKSHEYLFLLTKSATYFYDAEAIQEPVSPNTNMRLSQNLAAQIGSYRAHGGAKTNGPMKAVGPKAHLGVAGVVKHNASFDASVCLPVMERNKRSVWTVTTQPYREAHFATFPPDLIKPCVLAGSRPGDTILDPFAGSGTTGEVALELGRSAILIELNPAYVTLIEQRLGQVTPGLAF